ncbi:MAG: hypothetical protein WA109_09010 [Bellilinea sp.]
MQHNGTAILRFEPGQLELTADWVLQAQGADPVVLRARHPQVAEIAERALADGLTLLEPRALVRVLDVEGLNHQRLNLPGKNSLAGAAIGQHLAGAQQVAVVVYTSGVALETRIQQTMGDDAPYAFALDGVGNAAHDALSLQVYRHVSRLAEERGWQTSIFLNPGMIGWSVEQGQPQLFALIDAAAIGVSVNENLAMHPRKTTSGVIGLGPGMIPAEGPPCAYCTLNETCRFKGRHVHPGVG